jgi:hypothetical protein
VDLGFVAVSGIETLELTGISTVVLETKASAAGITKVVTGTGATSITTSSALATLSIDADDIADGTVLTLADGSGVTDFIVTNLEGDLTLTTLDATSSVTATFSNITGSAATVAAGTVGDLVLVGGDAGDTITVTGFTGATLTGSVAKFDITAVGGDQTIVGGALADTITGGAGADVIDGGVDNDKYVISAATADTGVAGGTTGAISTTALDVITVTAGDTIDLTASLGTEAGYDVVTVLTAATNTLTIGATAILEVRGTYSSSADTFTPGDSGADTMLNWASADGTTVDQSIILVGTGSGVDTIANGILTIV